MHICHILSIVGQCIATDCISILWIRQYTARRGVGTVGQCISTDCRSVPDPIKTDSVHECGTPFNLVKKSAYGVLSRGTFS